MTVQEAYNYSVYFLGANGVDEEEFKAKCLVCHLAKIANRDYHSHLGDLVSQKKLADGLWQLKSGTPLQYVLGEWDFLDSTFAVGPGVLIPRPETEELAQLAIEQVKNAGTTPVVWDLCAGSGCIGISIAKACPGASVYCVEKSTDAFAYLQKNAMPVANVRPVLADISGDLTSLPKPQVLVSNPPYIPAAVMPTLQPEVLKEPMMALDGGTDGLDFYRLITEKIVPTLASGTQLLLEIGDEQGGAKPVCHLRKCAGSAGHLRQRSYINRHRCVIFLDYCVGIMVCYSYHYNIRVLLCFLFFLICARVSTCWR